MNTDKNTHVVSVYLPDDLYQAVQEKGKVMRRDKLSPVIVILLAIVCNMPQYIPPGLNYAIKEGDNYP